MSIFENRRENVLGHFIHHKDYTDERVKSGIELYRKSSAKLAVKDKEGNPVPGVRIKAVQKTHDFNFGCNMFLLDEFETEEKNAAYREIFKTAFNYAIAPFYWDALEPEKGKPRYAKDSPKIYRRPAPDLVTEYCSESGIRVKGHCIVYDAFAPKWLPREVDGIKREIDRHIAELSERYAAKIHDWDITNESLSWEVYGNRVTPFFREPDYIDFCFDSAKRHFPLERKFINEAAGIFEGFHFNRTPFYMQLENLTNKGVPFDAIGLQFHQFVKQSEEKAYADRRYNPIKLYDVLDSFAEFKKPLQISEITVSSYNGDEEDREIQAELIENLYKIWFSHPAMDGVVYWNLVDGYTHSWDGLKSAGDMTKGENIYGGALLNHDLTPKPAFKVLQRLMNEEWHTECEVVTNEGGEADFRGFKGLYDVTFMKDGKKITRTVHLDKRADCLTNVVF